MDRTQHQRYLAYLQKFEYFGRGRARLDLAQFVALEAELATLSPTDPAARERRSEIRAQLLKD